MKYCQNCERMVEPKKHFSGGLLLVLLCLGVIPGILYYLIKPSTCPMCNSQNWGVPPKKKQKKRD